MSNDLAGETRVGHNLLIMTVVKNENTSTVPKISMSFMLYHKVNIGDITL